MTGIIEKMSEIIISGNIDGGKQIVQQALDEGTPPKDILDKGLLPGMDVVGQRMKTGEMFIPEVLRSAKTMQAGLDVLLPHLGEDDAAGSGTVVIGTVEGDLHDIGKNLVTMMLEGAGFKVIDLGTDVKAQGFLDAVKEHKAKILGLSALLTTTMPKMKETMDALVEAGIRDQIKIMAGGAPVNQKFVDEIGADAYGANAAMAVEKAKEILA